MVAGVNLDFRVHWCARHLEPLRAGWPAGAARAMVALFESVIADPEFVARMPKNPEGLAKTEALDGVLREHSPLCCWLGDERLARVYTAAGVTP